MSRRRRRDEGDGCDFFDAAETCFFVWFVRVNERLYDDGRTDDAMMMTTSFCTEKTARLRAAVEEAKVEIAAYRAEREGRYAQMVQEVRAHLTRQRARYRLVKNSSCGD